MTGLYFTLYNLLKDVIVGAEGSFTPYMEFSANLVCTVLITLLILLPFYVVYRVVRMICG